MKLGILTDLDHKDLIKDDRPLIPLLNELGIETVILPWEQILSFRLEDLNAVLIRTPWNYALHWDQFKKALEFISSKTKLINDLQTVYENYHKEYLTKLNYQGLDFIHGEVIKNFNGEFNLEQLKDYAQKWETEHFVIKPIVGASGRDTFKFSVQEQSFPSLVDREVYFQTFVPEIQQSGEVSAIYFGGEYSHAVRKFLPQKNNEFRIQEEHGGNLEAYHSSSQELEKIQKFLLANNYSLPYMRVDYCLREESLLLMELELIEPELFMRTDQGSYENFVKVIKGAL